MSGDWRMLALAALATATLTLACAFSAAAQAPSKTTKAHAPAAKESTEADEPKADDEEEEERKPEAAPKRKKTDPAEAQRAVEAAGKLVEAGKTDQAVQSLTTTLSAGNLPPAILAKAFMYRGMAYRQQQKPANAVADLTSALWLKGGLSPADRSTAMQARSAAYREAGLTETGQALAAASPQVKEKTAAGGAGSNWFSSTSTTETSAGQTSQQSGGSGWNLFGGLFGGGSNGASQTSTTTTSATAAKAVAETKASSWASNTEVRSEPITTHEPPPKREAVVTREPATREPAARQIETSAVQASPDGRFQLQLAMVRSQDEARALAAKVKRDYAVALANREPEVDQTVVGNMGSFYRVVVGQFSTQSDCQAACAKLKGSGLDCLIVTQ